MKSPFNEDVLARGQELNADNCIDCHSRPQWAFTGYAVSKIINPIAVALDQIGGVTLLWYIHFLTCFMGLAYLPFSKMFHVFATPISLMANTTMVKEESNSSNISTRQLMELDACTHCGTCNMRCSVIMAFEALGNQYILPSEKMVFLKGIAAGKELSPKELKAIQEGIYLCTNCDRCTVVCPSGINLKELWISIRENLLQTGYPEPLVLSPFSFVRGLMRGDLDQKSYLKPIILIRDAITNEHKQKVQDKVLTHSQTDRDFKYEVILSDNTSTFSACFNCKTCTSVCPVVANYENPAVVLGLLPHQIMHSLGLGLKALVLDSKMPWDCLTCYLCQEHCPKGVRITEVFYELKNLAIKHRIE